MTAGGRVLNPSSAIRAFVMRKWLEIRPSTPKVCTTASIVEKLTHRAQTGRRLGRQLEFEGVKQQLKFGFGLGVARQDEQASIAGGQVHIDHLDGFEFLNHGSRREPRGLSGQALTQGHVKAVGQKRDKKVRLDPLGFLMVEGSQHQVAFEVFEGFFDLAQQQVELPKLGRLVIL